MITEENMLEYAQFPNYILELWKSGVITHTHMTDFLRLELISIVLQFYPEEWKKIVPVDNAAPHILLLRLFDEYDDETWNAIK